jgi:hypothetical protein
MAYASGMLEIPLTGALLFAGGEVAGLANPEGVPLIITDVKIYVDTPSTGAANLSVGIGAAINAAYTNLINALAINGAITGLAYHGMTALAANGAAIVWGVAQFLTATGSASSVGFTGRLFVKYIRTA